MLVKSIIMKLASYFPYTCFPQPSVTFFYFHNIWRLKQIQGIYHKYVLHSNITHHIHYSVE